jgi:hypothetical protein
VRKSARILGQEYGLTAQEMNFVLREEGFLEGEPGAYSVTEKGARYATEQAHSRGTGGYAHYNRAWTTTTWDGSIADELDITDDRKRDLRRAISAAKQRIVASSDDGVADGSYIFRGANPDGADDDKDSLAAAVGVLLLAASAYGVYKAAPHIRQWWNDRAVPSLQGIRDRVRAKLHPDGETGEGPPSR